MTLEHFLKDDTLIVNDFDRVETLKLGNPMKFKTSSICFNFEYKGVGISTTGREVESYVEVFPELVFDPSHGYIELGAGLGGLVPYLIKDVNVTKKPVVVDLVDYSRLRDVLEYVTEQKDVSLVLKLSALEFMKRCNVYLSDKVELHNACISEFDFNRQFDACVDLCGCLQYHEGFRRSGVVDSLVGNRDKLYFHKLD